MKRFKIGYRAALLLATAALLLEFGWGQFWLGAAAALALALLGWLGASALFLAGVTVLVTVGALSQLPSYLLLFAVLGALAAWDLDRLEQRLKNAPWNATIPAMEKRHLGRLLLALVLGGTLAVAALFIRVQLGFGLELTLALALIVLLGQTLRALDR